MFQSILHGTFWSGIAMLANTLIRLIVFLILAIQLGPRAIGLVSMAMVFVALANRVSSDEISDGLLRKAEIDDLDKHTMFWMACGLGAFASGVVFFLAKPVGLLFGEASIAELICVLSVIPFLNSLSSVHKALLRRQFDFRALALYSLLASVLAGIVSIALAVLGGGAWSLVLFYILVSALLALLLWLRGFYFPKFRFARERAGPLFRTAYMMSNVRLLAFIEEHMPRFLLGFFSGAYALGLFMMAWNIDVGLRRAIWTTLSHVLAVASARFHRSKSADGEDKMQFAVNYSIEVPGTLALPMYLGFAAIAPEFFAAYFNAEWAQSGMVARYLSIGFGFSILYMIPLELLRGAGKTRLLLLASAVSALSVTAIVLFLARFGVETTAVGISMHFVLMTVASLLILRHGLGVDVMTPLLIWGRIALAALGMALAVRLALDALPFNLSLRIKLPLVIGLGALIYPLFLWILARPATNRILDIVQRSLRQLRANPGPL